MTLATALVLALPLAAMAAPTPADKCESSKNKTAGAYYSCRAKAEATAITKGLPADYSKCSTKFDDKWDGAETTGAGSCPDNVALTADMNTFIASQAAEAALMIAGAPIPDCPVELSACEGDLTTCDGGLTTCEGNLTTCDGGLTTCEGNLTTCDGGLTTCEGDLTICDGALTTCDGALTTCDGDLTTCDGALTTCDGDLTTCEGDLTACESAPVCGDGLVAGGEECDDGNLDGATCATQGFAGGTLACSFCTFDESDCYAMRFDTSGATIIDHQTGLEWEKKDSAGGGVSLCPGGSTCSNAHDVDNVYVWSITSTTPDGGLFTDFLAKLNGSATGVCYAGHCDWRLPTPEELQTVPWPANAAFLPDAVSFYLSGSTYAGFPTSAWFVDTGFGDADGVTKTGYAFGRAVRSGL